MPVLQTIGLSISLDLVNHVAKRLSFRETDHVVQHQLVVSGCDTIRHRGDVRRDDYILELPKRVAFGQRLGIGDVESRARQAPFIEGFD